MDDRAKLMAEVAASLERADWARALWEGGSAAFGRADGWSDVDAMAVVREGAVEKAFAAVEAAIEGRIARRHRLPEPTWHGHAQAFYQLTDAGPYRMIDLVVMEGEPDTRFLVRERHGEPVVAFDKDAVVAVSDLDVDGHVAKLERRMAHLRATWPVFTPLVDKELRRGHEIDALGLYHGLVLRPLVELLRIRHAPARHDFGLRYLGRDLPPEVAADVHRLSFVADAASLARALHRARTLFEGTMAALVEEGIALR